MDTASVQNQIALDSVNTHLNMRAALQDRLQGMDQDVLAARNALVAAQARAAAVCKQLASLEETICRSQRELAPVLSLPHDILCEIFRLWAQSEQTDTTLEHPGFVASKVCRAWRDVSVASPSVWAYFKLDFKPLRGNTQLHTNVLGSVQLQLQRSANAPLHVHLLNYDSSSARARRSYRALFDTVTAEASRWRSFYLTGDVTETEYIDFATDYLGYFFFMRTPLLETFTLQKCGIDPILGIEQMPFLPHAPRLRALTLCPDVVSCYELAMSELPELEVLEISPGEHQGKTDELNFTWLWRALQRWPHIRKLRVLGTREMYSYSDEDIPSEPLLMPKLETIHIDGTMETLDFIVPMLRLPKLRTVVHTRPVKRHRFECELFTRHGRSIRRLQLSRGWAPRDVSYFPNLEELSLRDVVVEGTFFAALAPSEAAYPCARLRALRAEQCRFLTPIIGANLARFVMNRTAHAEEHKVARLEDVVLSSAEGLEPVRTREGAFVIEGLPAWVHEYVRRALAGDECLALPISDD
ncbi:hypothetical protein AURDEDRAFT_117324, partial [Auricularia subglabra TFB-10046 SS5]